MLKQIQAKLRAGVSRIGKDRKGVVLPITGVMIFLLIVMAGAGVDYGRAINQREVMANALDSAALAVASQLSTSVMTDGEIGKMLKDVFKANLSSLGYEDQALQNFTHKVFPDQGVVEVSSSISVPTYFIHLQGIGPEEITVTVNAEVNYSKFDVELALVLDVTGSMDWAISHLKDAAESVVNTLIPAGSNDPKIRISIVPYSGGVNLDSYAETVTANLSDKCVTERIGSEKYTDASYVSQPFGDGSGTLRGIECSDSVIQPLTHNRNALLDAIEDMETDGWTAGQTGIAWGWYTLSPYWKQLWPAESEPASYQDVTSGDVLKFALIMTDGDFNTFYNQVNWKENKCLKKKSNGDYKGTCYSGTNKYWIEKSGGQSSNRAKKFCDEMKKSDISMYSVYFGNKPSSSGAKIMQYCADDGSYYQATSSADLINAFGNIARRIQAIYLAK